MITHIGFSGGLQVGQLGIQLATLDPYAHTFALLEGGTIIDSTYKHGGVLEREYKDLDCNWLYLIPCKDVMTFDQQLQLEVWLRDRIGLPYDTSFVEGFLGIDRNWKDNSQWWCSELIAAGMIATGSLRFIPHMNTLSPRNLRRRLEVIVQEKRDAIY